MEISSLPNELILQVLECLLEPRIASFESPRYDGTDHLSRLCLVSRWFNSMATPFMYTIIDQAGIDTRFWSGILGTLDRRPELRKYVKTIRVNGDFLKSEIPDYNDQVYQSTLLTIAKKLQLPKQEEIRCRARSAENVAVALLIFQTHNLEQLFVRSASSSLRMNPVPFWHQELNGIAYGLSFGQVHDFSLLKVLCVDPGYGTENKYMKTMLPLFLLPSLEDLTLCHWGQEWDEECMDFIGRHKAIIFGKPWKWPERSANIKRLSLHYPFVPHRIVSKAIRCCKVLERFECLGINAFDVDEKWYTRIMPALLEHNGTLREISIKEHNYLRDNDGPEYGTVEAVHDLIHLRVLCVPLYILVGHEGLSLSSDDPRMQTFIPKSITKLIIHLYDDVETDVEKYFTDLYLAHSNGHFPNLKEIWIDIKLEWHFLLLGVQSLKARFAENRVRFNARIVCQNSKPNPSRDSNSAKLFQAITLASDSSAVKGIQDEFPGAFEYDSKLLSIYASTYGISHARDGTIPDGGP